MEKILTVVMPSYNAAAYLPETVPTLLASALVDKIEILIVNDGSTDNTLEIANRFAVDYPQVIRVIDKENGGHGSTINAAIEVAMGKYFKVVDADDWVDTKNFDVLVQYLSEVNDDIVVSPYMKVYMDTNEYVIQHEFSEINDKESYDFDTFLSKIQHTVGMHTITIKTNILRDNTIRLGEKMFYVDMEYIIYPMPYINTISLLDIPVYQYRLGTPTQSVSLTSYIKNRAMHQEVIRRLIQFYNENKLHGVRKQVVHDQIQRMINMQLRLYLVMSDATVAKAECLAFEEQLPDEFKKEAPSKLVLALRRSRYTLFSTLRLYYKLFKKVRTN